MTSRTARNLLVGSLATAASLAAVTAPSMAATKTLNLTCQVPLIAVTQPATVTITTNLPSTTHVGTPTPFGAISVTTKLGGNTPLFLDLVGASSVEGTAKVLGNLAAPGVNVGLSVPATIPRTSFTTPAPNPLILNGTGTFPTIQFPQKGTGTLSATGVTLTLTARDDQGNPIPGIPSAGSDGYSTTFDIPCTIDAGQNTTLGSIKIKK